MNPLPKIFISFVLLFLLGNVSINQAEENNAKFVEMKNFLIAGPLKVKTPALINSNSDKINVKDILEYKYKDINIWRPKEDDKFAWDRNKSIEWEDFESTDKHGVLLESGDNKSYWMYYLASYIGVKSYFKGKIKLSSNHLFEVYVNGSKACSKTKSDSEKPEEDNFISGTLSLERSQ